MASVTKLEPDARCKSTRWQVRWRDPEGRQRAKTFPTKKQADDYRASVHGAMRQGTYVDDKAGQVPVKVYAQKWLDAQKWRRQSTQDTYGAHVRTHIIPVLGDRSNGSVRKTDVKTWVKDRSEHIAPTTLRTAYKVLAMIFRAAVDDGLIVRSPCDRIDLPPVAREKVVPLTADQVTALAAAMPEQYRTLVLLAAGTGLRQGEVFGLTVDRVDFLRRTVTVDRQLVMSNDRRIWLDRPKTDASYRTVPLPQIVVEALAAYLAQHPAQTVEIEDRSGVQADSSAPLSPDLRSHTGSPVRTRSARVSAPSTESTASRGRWDCLRAART